jgi:peptidoglycan/LPS O-acetylase OafA/YrhL
MNRIHGLDYLRGLAALSIMAYHFTGWGLGPNEADTLLGRAGIYGVGIFYALSGMTLHHVYGERLALSMPSLANFFRKRVLRIYPLLWIASIASIIIHRMHPTPLDLFLNLSGLFGFIRWDVYFTTGAWSIGNELAFYSVFPLLVWLAQRNRALLSAAILVAFGFYAWFAFYRIDPARPIQDQWADYANPLNQGFLFIAGFAISFASARARIPKMAVWMLLIAGLALFIGLPAEGDLATIASGWSRMAFTLSILMICTASYHLPSGAPPLVDRGLNLLGNISYSLYLLHPIVFSVVNRYLSRTAAFAGSDSALARMALAAVASFALSYLVHRYFERFFMGLGNRKAARPGANPLVP